MKSFAKASQNTKSDGVSYVCKRRITERLRILSQGIMGRYFAITWIKPSDIEFDVLLRVKPLKIDITDGQKSENNSFCNSFISFHFYLFHL